MVQDGASHGVASTKLKVCQQGGFARTSQHSGKVVVLPEGEHLQTNKKFCMPEALMSSVVYPGSKTLDTVSIQILKA